MPLAMARPWKHPKTGFYWLRRAVPDSLRQFVGKREEKRSLGTRDPEEARRLHAQFMAEIEARWANLRAGERTLTEREAHELAKPLFAKFLALYQDDPSQQPWHPEFYGQLDLTRAYDPADDEIIEDEKEGMIRGRTLDNFLIEGMRIFAIAQAEYVLEAQGVRVDIFSRLKLNQACAIAIQRASVILARSTKTAEPIELEARAERTDQATALAPAPLNHDSGRSISYPTTQRTADDDTPALTLTGLLAGWWSDAKRGGRKASTYESYSNTLKSFIAFLQHDDARSVKDSDVVAYKEYRLSTPSKRTGRLPTAKTVKDSDLAALRAVFGWAVDNKKLLSNPAAGITIRMSKPPRLRSKGFTDEEAKALLSASLRHEAGREAPKTYAAKRWVPWLCAFTGARVGELAQLRKEDVTFRGELWVMRITPEAGTVKTNEARDIVLHPQIVDLGFADFVERSATGHLFLTPRKDGDVLKPLQTLKNRLAEFGRQIISDEGVAPNHGWRHRFKTVGMEVGIPQRILDQIQGHASRSVSDDYGHVTLKTMADAVSKLPRFELA